MGITRLSASPFPLAEEAVSALGLVVWPMVEFEADDAIASAVFRYQDEAEIDVVICSRQKTWLNWFRILGGVDRRGHPMTRGSDQ
jgi:hypothetical protein